MIESLAVVTIIGMMAAAIMPGMTDMVASTRQHSAADEIMLLARQARREALLGGKYAYSLVFQAGAGNGTGAVQVITGITGYCNRASTTTYNDPVTGLVLPRGWQLALGGMAIGDLSFGSHRIFGVMEMPENQVIAGVVLCYAANGETHVTAPGFNNVEQTQVAVLRIRRDMRGIQKGIERQIVFMPGGTARLR